MQNIVICNCSQLQFTVARQRVPILLFKRCINLYFLIILLLLSLDTLFVHHEALLD